MQENAFFRQYQDRFDRVITYIYDHLDEEIDLNHLAEVACLSPYHWHRVYRGFSGETIAATVKRLRLHRSANQLVNTDLPMSEIIAQSGYSSSSAFSRAFVLAYETPPSQYRSQGSNPRLQIHPLNGTGPVADVHVRNQPSLDLVGLEYVGPYLEIGRAFEKLMSWGAQNGLMGPGMQSFAVYYDDEELVKSQKPRSFAGLLDNKQTHVEAPLERRAIRGGKFAVMRHKGPYSELARSYDWLYGSWLVQSGEILRDAPCVEAYLNNPREVAPSDLLTDIFMPIE